ncbi:hypothetical protein INR49_025262 [Caranx melampygus]|nr:hypothetical protein INR49_025262 [Caranx melampygus]
MTTTMIQSVMLTALMHISLVSYGVQSLEPEVGLSVRAGAVDLPWQDELCCDSPSAHLNVEAGSCLDILCSIDESWEKLTCDLQSHGQTSTIEDAGLMVVSLQRLLPHAEDSQVNSGKPASDNNPVVCEAKDSFMCSLALDTTTSFATLVTVSVSSAVAPPIQLRVPARPVKPGPPVNLSHNQTIEAELILHWDNPPDFTDAGPLRYEVRYSSNTTHPAWQVVSAPAEPRLSLDLKPRLKYTIQARCSGPDEPPLWSNWSESHHIYLDTVSYIPEKVVARPGENVTVYCVFNDHSINASTALWVLNFEQQLDSSQYHPVNQLVSQITVRPSDTRMYDLLQCTKYWTIPYSQIYVEGASININCETNGDIDAMECSWERTQWTEPKLQYRWSDMSCYVMEERERAGEIVGEEGPACRQVSSMRRTCSIQPLRMNCYKLWLEMSSTMGPIRSKPVYLSPIDHVKPHTPTNVKAVSLSSGVLRVTWERPFLPVEGLQCQFQYHSPSMLRGQPEWKSPVRVTWAEVAVPDMCWVYAVQVRCKHINDTGYWSEWSSPVYSTPQNSRVPERGPDFWRILQDDSYRNQTNVTLLFEVRKPKKILKVHSRSYCVDGFIIQHQTSNDNLTTKLIGPVSSYSFEWNQELQTVTVEAYNSVGSSTSNINMTLTRHNKRPCVRSFRVLVINNTCVSLSWSLLDNSSVPLSMVVQWSPQRQQGSDHHKVHSGNTWARLPYTDHPVYLRGDLFGSEEFVFYLYPVFADGEGEPVRTIAARGDPAAYVMLMIIAFLSIVLFVILVFSQNQMKRFVWKDVPNPNKCSWAQGIDFKKTGTLDHLLQPRDDLPAWPLLLPSENISKAVIVDRADLAALTTALVQTPLVSLTPDPAAALAITELDSEVDQSHFVESEVLMGGAPPLVINLGALTSSHQGIDMLQSDDPRADQPPGSTDSSAQSSVTYATVLLSEPKQNQQSIHLHYKDGSGSSSSDEGNFSANNSDISGSFPGGLWELDSCRGGEMDDPRRSCSYNSVEELSETSEQEDEGEVREEKDLFYLGMDHPAEDEESEEEQSEEETKIGLLENVVLNREDCLAESQQLLGLEDLSGPTEHHMASTCGFSPLYLPQFRTAPCTRQLHESKPQL